MYKSQKGFAPIQIILSIIAGTVLLGGVVGGVLYFSKQPSRQTEQGKCGDGVCDALEKVDTNLCPQDCEIGSKDKSSKIEADKQTNLQKQDEQQLLQLTKILITGSPFGFIQGGYSDEYDLGVIWDKTYGYTSGAGWEMIENVKGKYDFTTLDKTFSDASNYGVNVLLPLVSLNSLYGSDTENPYPSDMSAFKNFVKAVVERYDGDGAGDAGGNVAKVKYWAIGKNEVDLRGNDYWQNNIDKFNDVLKASCEAIKEACSDCRAVLSGSGSSMEAFSRKGDVYTDPVKGGNITIKDDGIYFKIISSLGANNCSDMAIDYHWWGDPVVAYKEQKTIIGKIKTLRPNAEIWTTEGGSFSDFKGFTEKQQAGDVIKRYVYALANGQAKLFWTRIVEFNWSKGKNNNLFDHTGLINNPANDGNSHKKLSYYTYKKMVEVLDGSDWNNIQTIQEKDGVYIYKFTKNNKPIWVAWNDISESKQITISDITSNQIKITETIPKYEIGKDASDYSTAFNVETKAVSGGKIIITLKDIPVFVE